MQRHYRNSRCFGGLLRIAGLCHICDIYNIFRKHCKSFCFGHLSPANRRSVSVEFAGQPIRRGQTYCASCAVGVSREGLIEAAKLGRIATHSLEAETLRAKTQRKHAAALAAWQPSELPEWLNEEAYRDKDSARACWNNGSGYRNCSRRLGTLRHRYSRGTAQTASTALVKARENGGGLGSRPIGSARGLRATFRQADFLVTGPVFGQPPANLAD